MNTSEQITVLEFAELITSIPSQTIVDNLVRSTLAFEGAPRVFELRRDVDGRPSLIWVTRTRKEWNDLTIDASLRVAAEGKRL